MDDDDGAAGARRWKRALLAAALAGAAATWGCGAAIESRMDGAPTENAAAPARGTTQDALPDAVQETVEETVDEVVDATTDDLARDPSAVQAPADEAPAQEALAQEAVPTTAGDSGAARASTEPADQANEAAAEVERDAEVDEVAALDSDAPGEIVPVETGGSRGLDEALIAAQREAAAEAAVVEEASAEEIVLDDEPAIADEAEISMGEATNSADGLLVVGEIVLNEAEAEGRPAARADAGAPPPYPWPPEPPSSTASLDAFLNAVRGDSMGALSEDLAAALVAADYADHRFYSAPGGFVLVTRLEEISEEGDALEGRERYRLPSDPRRQSFADYLRGLFLEAPPGLWRYIAIVVSNRAIQFDAEAELSSASAAARLSGGATRLDGALAEETFSNAHRATALIYEFRKTATDETAAQVEPGRIPPVEHLVRTGIATALGDRFSAQ